jgi:hypothetical protein
MEHFYSPPLTVNFIWNPSDSDLVMSVLNVIRESLTRDRDKPFSRSLNIPFFQYSSSNGNETPSKYPRKLADKTIIFVFTSLNTVGNSYWSDYIEGIPLDDSVCIVPIALDQYGLNHAGTLYGLNCIRAYDWPSDNKSLFATVSLAHEIYRHGCVQNTLNNTGSDLSIKLFLSHSKRGGTGLSNSVKVKEFIDNTSMKRFFDATEIAPGFSFSEEIEKHIPDSTLIAFESDSYSSRYWCQREILCAKENNRPVVVVNCLDAYEDRIFPAASNVPCVRISASKELGEKDVLRILSTAIIETIRFELALKSLQKYKEEEWLAADCHLFARPPEIRQILTLSETSSKTVYYPDPPIFAEEADWHSLLGVRACTPLWDPSDHNVLTGIKVGISISDRNENDFSETHSHPDQLIILAQELARHMLARSATLIYGGDLRQNGFTEFILDEATILKERLKDTDIHIENHLAWPLYLSDKNIVAWRAKYRQIMSTVQHAIPNDVSSGISNTVFLPPNSPENSYIWSRCLTSMREKSIDASTIRICAGGKASGYKGKMPGVLEEIIISLVNKKPIFLFGGFDGIVGDVCNALLNKNTPDTLTADWQTSNNSGYSALQGLAESHNHHCDYQEVISFIHNISLADLASNAGLSEPEYRRLMVTPFVDECVYSLLKGLKQLKENT